MYFLRSVNGWLAALNGNMLDKTGWDGLSEGLLRSEILDNAFVAILRHEG